MGKDEVSLTAVLFSKSRQRVLGLLYGRPEEAFHTNEIIRLTHCGSGVIQRELQKLSQVGLLLMRKVGNQKRYQANEDSPLYHELRSIILKTVGLTDVLKVALAPFKKQISIAFIYGSIASKTETATSDIDLMLIAEDLTYADLYETLEKGEKILARKINPTIYTPKDWQRRFKQKNNFLLKVARHSKIFILGTENDLKQLTKPG